MNQDHSLSWYNFTEHLEQLFANLYKEESYADVTLVSSDQFEFKAHKIVLSACSPVLKKIIDDNARDLPLVYQTKILSQEIEAILHFMYIGVGKFYQHRMEEFIKAAKDLKIKHFCLKSLVLYPQSSPPPIRIPPSLLQKTVASPENHAN